MKKISLLGSTGSIGKSTLEVVRHLGYEVTALGCHSNIDLLEEQIKEFAPKKIAVFDEKAAAELKGRGYDPLVGQEGMCEIAVEGDIVVMAIMGLAALAPTLAALDAKKWVGLANKEVLVAAGELVMSRVQSPLIPIDSEHSALFQCLEKTAGAKKLVLTASGGPFREHSQKQLEQVTVEQALKHPTWDMGAKITIDSSTLMNKGFEVIEAHHLFGFPMDQIDVVVHPQSLIHCFVEGPDGVLFAQLHEPSMTIPIQYALTYPLREKGLAEPFDFFAHSRLDFHKPDRERFRCLEMAFEAVKRGKSSCCFLNGANEVLVERFLRKEISWVEIGQKLERLMEAHSETALESVECVMEIDKEARKEAMSR
ncbi:MAG: 1-deoxy-D-xylulose 5-phosphate reductoisomerase [Chlamydiales bacterium]|nr:1-deoxy-D-xylulose 5-phosphate reductoisomerase [Chlamydiales bacterium]MCH9703417.1 1-deoxy-D-xylulose-5-phosphate reductoisomerase [Chlamydiota bacterium]